MIEAQPESLGRMPQYLGNFIGDAVAVEACVVDAVQGCSDSLAEAVWEGGRDAVKDISDP